eukprot:m.1503790 g.1503790  ORF g.1503790 m.1503790 type:complete len:277 (+) comp25208_c0_seq15:2694-3524(+)
MLGPNGAGKSTAFNIATGLLTSTSGDVFVNENSVAQHRTAACRDVGACPQFPRLWGDLTVRDHLGVFVALRGLPSPFSFNRRTRALGQHAVEVLATAMQIGGPALEKHSSALSGGMRRRLSLAISLIGAPPLLILDEPTTGLDPITRRDVWELLQKMNNDSRSCVISTHSMEEADTLCSRIAIMTRGKLRVVDAQDRLKTRFGSGYTVMLSASAETFDVPALLRSIHPEAVCTNLRHCTYGNSPAGPTHDGTTMWNSFDRPTCCTRYIHAILCKAL